MSMNNLNELKIASPLDNLVKVVSPLYHEAFFKKWIGKLLIILIIFVYVSGEIFA